MSELKYYKLFHRASALTSPEFISVVEFGTNEEVYLKSEADEVIAEWKEQFFQLQDTAIKLDKKLTATKKQIRHQKYKRCLAMANWCEFYADTLRVKRNQCRYDEAELAESYYIRCRRYRRWCKVWLELAEKFKPNNSTAQ